MKAERAEKTEADPYLAVIRDAARSLLGSLSHGTPGLPAVAAPLPVHARRLLDRLLGEPVSTKGGNILHEPFHSFDEFREAMRQTPALPVEAGRFKRGQQLTLMMAMTHLTSGAPWFVRVTLLLVIADWLERRGIEMKLDPNANQGAVSTCSASWLCGASGVPCCVGDSATRLSGIHLCRHDGQGGSWQCAAGTARLVADRADASGGNPDAFLVPNAKQAVTGTLAARCCSFPLMSGRRCTPGQALHDRILGVYLVPNQRGRAACYDPAQCEHAAAGC